MLDCLIFTAKIITHCYRSLENLKFSFSCSLWCARFLVVVKTSKSSIRIVSLFFLLNNLNFVTEVIGVRVGMFGTETNDNDDVYRVL